MPPIPISSDISGRKQSPQIPTRPELSTAGRSKSAGSLPAKKAKTPARKDGSTKTQRPPKATTPAVKGTKPATTPSQQTPPQAPGAAETPSDDLDNITTGMKKIKINLITQSQKAARQRREAERANTASRATPTPSEGGSTPIVSPTLELQRAAPSFETAQRIASEKVPDSVFSSSRQTADHDADELEMEDQLPELPTLIKEEPEDYSLSESSPSVPQVAVSPSSDPADVFIPYQPEGPAATPATPTEPLKWLPPNVPTPSANTPAPTPAPMKKNANLFHYTPGSIPFAPRAKSPTKSSPPPS